MAKRDVVRLLVRLYGDPRLQEKLARDAEKTMKGARLSKAERELLASNDAAAIGRYLGKDGARTRLAGMIDMLKLASTGVGPAEGKAKKRPAGKSRARKGPRRTKPASRKPKKR